MTRVLCCPYQYPSLEAEENRHLLGIELGKILGLYIYDSINLHNHFIQQILLSAFC